MDLKAVFLNCTLKASPEDSNTEALARVVDEALEADGIATEFVRVVDHDVRPGRDLGRGRWRRLAGHPAEAG